MTDPIDEPYRDVHRHGGVDWPSALECPLCTTENDKRNYRNWYQDALSREQGERILRLRAESDAARLRDAIVRLCVDVENYQRNHDLHGGGAAITGRCWDKMTRARIAAARVLDGEDHD